MSTDNRDEVARRAYERYEARGQMHGDDQADWYAAERELRHDNSSMASEPPPDRGRPPRGATPTVARASDPDAA